MRLPSFLKPSPKPARHLPALRLRNTLSGELEVFEPLGKSVKMYNCGPTAYDEQHIGNFFPPVVANLLHRTLEVWGYKVEEVNNITDFGHLSEDEKSEDKMTRGLRREGKALNLKNMRWLAEKYATLFFADLPGVGVNPEKIRYPRASDYIQEQIAVIKTLEQKGYAYRTESGVYFDISRFANYGKLGGIDLEGLKPGARLEENKDKRNPGDFVLWKPDKKIGWESPWGLGFPGWHTECVAMIFTLLGKQIDIHMGGVDLIPIHHNNEIAQAESATGKQFARYWVHTAHITIENKKISKSLRNTVYLHNLIDKGIDARALRYWFLTGHYRTPMNFTWDAIEGANTAYNRLARAFLELPPSQLRPSAEFLKDFYAAIADDLNTPQALARCWDLLKDPSVPPAVKRASLAEADKILGLGLGESGPTARVSVISLDDLPYEVQKLVGERSDARAAKDFKRSDELREQIERAGFAIKDTQGGQKVTKK
ncbi:MAG TPA: cysteine--tRNA ligase [Candidatus Paceibacterota bacterium]|jgi:cysteinyl-tRNA synthetase|nr:cysteine--tRNA ligase [Candidatus Paceibacterota bacterium]